jgi:tRNA(fMet)-specific endonuclease VapC
VIHLLDSNICIGLLKGKEPGLKRQLSALSPREVVLCSVVKAELLYGARRSSRVDANLRRLERLFAQFESLPFDDNAAEWYGVLRGQLERSGQLVGNNDLMIASTALSAGACLVTRDEHEFSRVPGLRVLGW